LITYFGVFVHQAQNGKDVSAVIIASSTDAEHPADIISMVE
jgi:hypothetical protein